MLRNYYINKEWMLSVTASRVYRASAVLSGALFLLIIALPFVAQVRESFLPIMRLFVFVGALGAAITIVAMEYFLFGFDNSSALKRLFWFLVMLLPLLGPSLYCFIVYLRSDVVRAARTGHSEQVSLISSSRR
jgi:NADH:ubiquinone oxidoreductase subunit 6 (subunit J)